MKGLYPEIEPYDRGWLDVDDGHRVYWETCGNPKGRPALVLHGGPGSGCSPRLRRCFDPDAYRIVLHDQRGCGRSLPHAGEPDADLSANTTPHLLADVERLRAHLGIDRWLVHGRSWGSTLALAYAQRHTDRVLALVLASVATTTRWEIDWITRGVGIFFPREWAAFRDGVPEAERDGDLSDAYHRQLMHPDPAVHETAARQWCEWEAALLATGRAHAPDPRWNRPSFRLGFARLVTHYWRNGAWIEEGALLRDAGRLSGVPGVLIHGRLDFSGPLITPLLLADGWPGSELVVVGGAGHDARDDGIGERVVAATDRFAALA